MKINSVNNQSFGLKRTSTIRYNSNATKTFTDTVHLENGKKVIIAKTCDKFGAMTEKLQYVKDNAGNWVKSKLKFYTGGKVVKEIGGNK
jgi:hypothetical protein